MLNFDFCNPTKILFGKDRIADINKEIPATNSVLIAYGSGSIKRNGVYDQVVEALGDRKLFEFGGIEPNPTYETLMECVEMIRTHKVDFILAVGGGSVIDGIKFVAAAVDYKGEPWEILQTRGANIKSAMPFADVLTLPATGSEMNTNSVITKKSIGAKLAFSSPLVFPKFSVLDPQTTFSLPEKQTSNGIVDAFVHVMEQYMTYPADASLQDRFAESILVTLIEKGPELLANPNNYDLRAEIMWCATMALNGLIGSGVPQDWATHMLGHEITAMYGVDHARTLAIVLPSMLIIRKKEKWQKLLQYADRVWGISCDSEEKTINAAIDKTREFFESVKIKTRMSDYGIDQTSSEKLVAKLQEHNMTQLGEHQDVTIELSRKIYEMSL